MELTFRCVASAPSSTSIGAPVNNLAPQRPHLAAWSSPHRIETSTGEYSLDLSQFGPGGSSLDLADFVPYDREVSALGTNEIDTFPAHSRISGHWATEYEVQNGLSLYSRGYVDHRRQVFASEPAFAFDVVVPATNPYNPFGEEVLAIYTFGPNEAPGPSTETLNTLNYQATIGLTGEIGRYNFDLGYTTYRQSIDEDYKNDVIHDRIQAAAERTDASAFNPFCYWCNPRSLFESVTEEGSWERIDQMNTIDLTLNGDLIEWGPGAIQFAVGYQHREIEYSHDWGDVFETSYFEWYGGYLEDEEGERDVDAFFGELRVPLYDRGDDVGFLQSAEISGAVRNEHYSDFGSATVWQTLGRIGFWGDAVIVRASYSESFRAPSVAELTAPQTTLFYPSGFLYDPVQACYCENYQMEGGNLDLDPELGETINFGIVIRPPTAPGLHLSLDYWALEISDIIRTPDAQSLLNGTEAAGSVTRDPLTSVPTLDLRWNNGGVREVSGFDIGVVYDFAENALGEFSAYLNATYITKFEEDNGSGAIEYLDEYTSAFGAVPELRLAAGLNWSRGPIDAAFGVNFTDGFRDYVSAPIVIDRRADSQVTVDVQAGYEFGPDEQSARLYLGVQNLFDEGPPFVAESGDGWDRTFGDLRGRYVYIGARKRF